jgi:hypothetical protein
VVADDDDDDEDEEEEEEEEEEDAPRKLPDNMWAIDSDEGDGGSSTPDPLIFSSGLLLPPAVVAPFSPENPASIIKPTDAPVVGDVERFSGEAAAAAAAIPPPPPRWESFVASLAAAPLAAAAAALMREEDPPLALSVEKLVRAKFIATPLPLPLRVVSPETAAASPASASSLLPPKAASIRAVAEGGRGGEVI